MSTRFRCGEWLLLGFVLSGCINPDDILGLTGRVRSERAVEGQKVLLSRESFASAGGPCVSPVPHDAVTVGASGAFEFELLRAEAQRLTGYAAGFCLRVETTFDSGVSYQVDIPSMNAELELPEFVEWNPDVRFDGGFQFEPAPFTTSDAGDVISHRVELRSDGGVVWRWDSHGLDQVDPRIFSEFESDEVAMSAQLIRTGENPFLGPTITSITTARVTVPLTIPFRRVAWSFGAPCSFGVVSCPLTDRSLDAFELNDRELELNLQGTVFVDLIVVRGLVTTSDAVKITVLDGLGKAHPFFVVLPRSAFNREAEERFFALPIDLGGNAAWLVRLEFPEPVTMIREVSVFRPE